MIYPLKKKILFRADGNTATGLGHLYRLFALVEMYKDDYNFVFLTKQDSVLSIIPSDYVVKTIPNNINLKEEPFWIGENFSSKEHIIIADGYQFESSYQKKIKELGFILVYIDDLAKSHMYADIVVNHSPHIKPEHFKLKKYTKLVLGTKYAMLRPLFNKAALTDRKIKVIKNVFVCFGGADMYDLSIRAAKALLNIDEIQEIHIVLGGAYKHREIFEVQSKNDKLKLYKNLNEESLCDLMKSCQLAIVPSSTIIYEICSIKMPILSGYYVENQKNIYTGLVVNDVIFEGGDFTNYSVLDFEEKIRLLLAKGDLKNRHIANQKALFDGKSKSRFLGLVNSLNISFRSANDKDVLLVYNWSNDELVRKNSYNSKPIKLEEHRIWFSNTIKDKNTLFFIVLVNDNPAGMVRYKINKRSSVISILVSKEYRGQKLAKEFLKKSSNEYFKNNKVPIFAYIKKENKASIKVFENAGYTYFKDENIQGSVSFVYKLEKQDVKR